MDRKEWLLAQIDELTNKELFDELSEVDKIFLGGYKDELAMMELKEQGLLEEGGLGEEV